LKLKILKKLRTASINSEFIGSYKKCYDFIRFDHLFLTHKLSIMRNRPNFKEIKNYSIFN